MYQEKGRRIFSSSSIAERHDASEVAAVGSIVWNWLFLVLFNAKRREEADEGLGERKYAGKRALTA
jgi:hypothetical protein